MPEQQPPRYACRGIVGRPSPWHRLRDTHPRATRLTGCGHEATPWWETAAELPEGASKCRTCWPEERLP